MLISAACVQLCAQLRWNEKLQLKSVKSQFNLKDSSSESLTHTGHTCTNEVSARSEMTSHTHCVAQVDVSRLLGGKLGGSMQGRCGLVNWPGIIPRHTQRHLRIILLMESIENRNYITRNVIVKSNRTVRWRNTSKLVGIRKRGSEDGSADAAAAALA